MAKLWLKPGRERSVQLKHPWIFSGAVASVEGTPYPGETVDIYSSKGEWLACGAYSPQSQIRTRIWTWNEQEKVDSDFLRARLGKSIQRRLDSPLFAHTNAIRLVHAESDYLPGLIVDRYADQLVIQVLSWGIEIWRNEIVNLLVEITGLDDVYERSDVDVRALEGLESRAGRLRGKEPSSEIVIEESGLKFGVDIAGGHKTGFYLDQRENRRLVRTLSSGKEVLDLFTYTGGFALTALAGGARSVVAVDSSEQALRLADENRQRNQFPAGIVRWENGDVFKVLREYRDRGLDFDMVILDPPKFAPTSAQAQKAARGYKDINLLAFKLLRPGGTLITFSCSGGIGAEFFQKIVFGAALDAGVEAQIIERLGQAADHPVALTFPEGAYLKGLVIQAG